MKRTRSLGVIAVALAAVFVSADTWAAPTVKQGCTLSEAGIRDEKGFEKFFFGFKKAVKENDFNRISDYAFYPLRISSRFGVHTIQSRAELMPLIRLAMNERVKEAIQKQSLAKLTCRDEGVSFGNGKVWVSQRGNRVGVFAIELE